MRSISMEGYGEYHDAKNSTVVQFHQRLPLEYVVGRMEVILADTGVYDPDEIDLYVDLGPFSGTVVYGIIRTKRGRIFELHVLDHPKAVDRAFYDLAIRRNPLTFEIPEILL